MSLSNIIGKSISNPNEVASYNLTVNSIEANSIIFNPSQFGFTYTSKSTSQAFTNSFSTVIYPIPLQVDAGLSYNMSTGIFTVVTGGMFTISYTNFWDADVSGARLSAIINGTVAVAVQVGPSSGVVAFVHASQSSSFSATLSAGSSFYIIGATTDNCNMLGSSISINRISLG